jgi:hypothetical protein
MTNPLIDKYNEIYGKKEKPKLPRIEDYEGEETIADELKKSRLSILKCFDRDDLKDSFIETAFKVKTGLAQVSSMNMEMNNHLSLKKITFEVMVYEP